MPTKPTLFIGSSVEGRDIAYAIQQNLLYDAEITVWDQGVFDLSDTTIESLVARVDASDFGIFVFSPDDIQKTRGTKRLVARDNVIFELGLFIGKIGRRRTFVITPQKSDLSIPTDLLGITSGRYENTRSDANMKAGTGAFCHQVRTAILELGKRDAHITEAHDETSSIQPTEGQTSTEEKEEPDWISFYLEGKYALAVSKLDEIIPTIHEEKERIDLEIWKLLCEANINLKAGLNMIESYIQANDDNPFIYYKIAWIYEQIGQRHLAKITSAIGIEKFPQDSKLAIYQAELLSTEGKVTGSVSLLESYADKDEDVALKLSEYLEGDLDDKDKAFEIIHRIYLQNTASERIRHKLAGLARETNRNELCLFLLNELRIEFPNNITYLTQFGNACLVLDFNDLAIISYKKANELAQEKQGWIISNIGNILKNQGFYTDAKSYFLKTIEMKSDSVYVYNRLSELSKAQEDETKRFEKLRKQGRTEAFSSITSSPIKLEQTKSTSSESNLLKS